MQQWCWVLCYDGLVINVLRLNVFKNIWCNSIESVDYKVVSWVTNVLRNVGSALKLRSNLWSGWIDYQSRTAIVSVPSGGATFQLLICIVYHLHFWMTATQRWGFVQLLIWIRLSEEIIYLWLFHFLNFIPSNRSHLLNIIFNRFVEVIYNY